MAFAGFIPDKPSLQDMYAGNYPGGSNYQQAPETDYSWLDNFGTQENPTGQFSDMANSQPGALPGVQVGAPPMLNEDPRQWYDMMGEVDNQIGNAYNFQMPQAETDKLDLSNVPQALLQQFGESPELRSFLDGEGFTPQQLSLMQTQAREAPAMAGQQQLAQMKQQLQQAGIEGPAAAGMLGDVSRNVGYAQNANLQNVALGNAQQSAKNKQFGVGMQSNIGMSNMQQANMMALNNANMMFDALRANQQAQNSMNQFNTGAQQQQAMGQAGAQAGFRANAGQAMMSDVSNKQFENANKQWGQQLQNTNYDWQKQLQPWQEMNQRYGQAVGTLGSWGQ